MSHPLRDSRGRTLAFYEKVFVWLAYCADSAGKGFGIMQADESATS